MTWKVITQATPEDMAARYAEDPHAEYPDVRRQMLGTMTHEEMTPDQIFEHMEGSHHEEMPLNEALMDSIASSWSKVREARGNRDRKTAQQHIRHILHSMGILRDDAVEYHKGSAHSAVDHSHPGRDSEEGRAAQARLEEFRQRGRTEPLTEEEKQF